LPALRDDDAHMVDDDQGKLDAMGERLGP